ncbi:unnamed protein product [Rotaria magnacalcarata]|uniref:Uncharacterized protein n=2 Tax=Rotaria magnacalcarata TaxID=392030 RepID=A0A816WAX4_9BILA|nr:unnamed protein product [Rotaria magnacalcarata]CAF2128981.1 unnamed protein product [Rotaria magnacalcarata]CAF4004319.1 unnamed protein product [Rotaria magnacalcarata]
MQTIACLVIFTFSTCIIDGRSAAIGGCPRGKPMVYCLIDPCTTSTCPGDKSATCTANYCGGCNAIWTSANGKPAKCSTCPSDHGVVQCFVDPCKDKTCPKYPDAKCVANYCGGCNDEWFLANGQQVQCRTTASSS